MAKHNVKCLVCGIIFDANEEEYEIEGRRYIHIKCAEQRKKEKMYEQDIHNYISHIYGNLYSKTRIDKQIKEMVEDGKTIENINKTLKYWYSVKGNDPSKSQGSIRIVNYVYNEAIEYFNNKEKIANVNKNINIKDIINNSCEELIIKPKPIGKPKRIKLFDLR